ncbi:copper chaperone PCu(A)C [Nocardioides sp.]|uniref:copper chaperone PCu(A)C n=1 Tax=Nocardioides sp. TaxID=35761 RepID=UPI003517A569
MNIRTTRSRALLGAAPAALVLALGLTACGEADTTDATGTTSTTDAAASDAPTSAPAAAVQLTDAYVKATTGGMTAAFGTLVNTGDRDLSVVSATSSVAGLVELHEVVAAADGSMAMQPKEGGFVIPAGGTHELSPGGDHVMLMDLTGPLEPGTSVTVVLTLDDGSTLEVSAPVKEIAGGDETYQGGDMTGMDGMDGMDGMEMPSEDAGS